MKIIYFTGTGNSLHVAKTLCDETYSIPKLIEKEIYSIKDKELGIIFPCYLYGMPEIVERYLKKVEINSEYTFIIVTMGSKDNGTLQSVEEIFKKKGISIQYTNHIAMIDNFLPLYDINVELKNKKHAEIEEKIHQIKKDITQHEEEKVEISKKQHILTKITRPIRNNFIAKRGDIVLYSNNKCNNCKLCETYCPISNIKIIENKVKFKHECQMCMRCVHICPTNALHARGEKSDARYINENINLTELK